MKICKINFFIVLYDKHCLYRATPFASKGVALHIKGCSHPG